MVTTFVHNDGQSVVIHRYTHILHKSKGSIVPSPQISPFCFCFFSIKHPMISDVLLVIPHSVLDKKHTMFIGYKVMLYHLWLLASVFGECGSIKPIIFALKHPLIMDFPITFPFKCQFRDGFTIFSHDFSHLFQCFSYLSPMSFPSWHSPRLCPRSDNSSSVKDHHGEHGFKDGRLHDAPTEMEWWKEQHAGSIGFHGKKHV